MLLMRPAIALNFKLKLKPCLLARLSENHLSKLIYPLLQLPVSFRTFVYRGHEISSFIENETWLALEKQK